MTDTIERFYESFSRLDPDGMAECYHRDVVFEDPAFGILQGEQVMNMWRMLCDSQKGKDFRIEYSDIEINDSAGSAHWEAFYTFQTGRRVHNKIDAAFRFEDNLIIDHRDTFNLYRWSIQAVGFPGLLFGWSSYFKKKLNRQARSLLRSYEEKRT